MIQTCALVSNVLINALRDWPKYLNMELAACLTVEAGWDKYNKNELMYLGQFDNIIGRGNTCGKKSEYFTPDLIHFYICHHNRIRTR